MQGGRERTLELRRSIADGFEVIATGMTVGGVVPTGIPADEGPVQSGGALTLPLGTSVGWMPPLRAPGEPEE